MKMRVENRADGTTLVQGKVWPGGEAEPTAWTIQKDGQDPAPQGIARACTGTGIRTCSSTTCACTRISSRGLSQEVMKGMKGMKIMKKGVLKK